MKTLISLSVLLFYSAGNASAQTPVLTLRLRQVQDLVLEKSPRVKSAEHQWLAAEARSARSKTQMFPALNFDANYRYVSQLPSFRMTPGAAPLTFGTHDNYSVGPSILWTLWDMKGNYNSWKGLEAASNSKKEEYVLARVELLQAARLAYFQLQLALEQMRLLADSLKLAQDQYQDISLQQKAGTLSRIDSLSAHRELLRHRREFRQAQTDMSVALRELFALTGLGDGLDASVPMDSKVIQSKLLDLEPPTLVVILDSLVDSRALLNPSASGKPNLSHPNILAFAQLARASELAAKSLQAGRFPAVQFSAKSSVDYPNGPVPESVQQNTLGLSASFPIFEWGRVSKGVREQKELAASFESRREQAEIDLMRDWEKARDRLNGLKAQQVINQQSVKECESLVSLVYDSYRAGRSTYLEVENADLRLLESKISYARTETQILIQLSILDSLSIKEQ